VARDYAMSIYSVPHNNTPNVRTVNAHKYDKDMRASIVFVRSSRMIVKLYYSYKLITYNSKLYISHISLDVSYTASLNSQF